MSVVIAIKHKNKIYLGCDTQVSASATKQNLKGTNQKILDSRTTCREISRMVRVFA